MALEFSQMLKQTLDKMSERIVISNDDWDAGTGQEKRPADPGVGAATIQKRLEGFALANLSPAPS